MDTRNTTYATSGSDREQWSTGLPTSGATDPLLSDISGSNPSKLSGTSNLYSDSTTFASDYPSATTSLGGQSNLYGDSSLYSHKTSSSLPTGHLEWREVHKAEIDCARNNKGSVLEHTQTDCERYNEVLAALDKLKIVPMKPVRTLKSTDSEYLKECYQLPGAQPAWKRKGKAYLDHGEASLKTAAESLSARIKKMTASALHAAGRKVQPSAATSDTVTSGTDSYYTTSTTGYVAAPSSWDTTTGQSSTTSSALETGKAKGQEVLETGKVKGQEAVEAGKAKGQAALEVGKAKGQEVLEKSKIKGQEALQTSKVKGQEALVQGKDKSAELLHKAGDKLAPESTETQSVNTAALKSTAKELAREGGSALKTAAGSLMATAQQKGSELFHKAGSKMQPSESTTETTSTTSTSREWETSAPSYTAPESTTLTGISTTAPTYSGSSYTAPSYSSTLATSSGVGSTGVDTTAPTYTGSSYTAPSYSSTMATSSGVGSTGLDRNYPPTSYDTTSDMYSGVGTTGVRSDYASLPSGFADTTPNLPSNYAGTTSGYGGSSGIDNTRDWSGDQAKSTTTWTSDNQTSTAEKGKEKIREGQHGLANVLHRAADKVDPAVDASSSAYQSTGVTGGRDYSRDYSQ